MAAHAHAAPAPEPEPPQPDAGAGDGRGELYALMAAVGGEALASRLLTPTGTSATPATATTAASGTVLHVQSAWRDPASGAHHSIRIDTASTHLPHSTHDFFLLNLCRARADWILTTGAILRAEPGCVHSLLGPHAAALSAWRAEVLGKPAPATAAVLTRNGADPAIAGHCAFVDGTARFILTGREHRAELLASCGTPGGLPSGCTVAGSDAMCTREAVTILLGQQRTEEEGEGQSGQPATPRTAPVVVSVECGPSASAELYDGPGPPMVDEVFFSVFEGELHPTLCGQPVPGPLELPGYTPVHAAMVPEPSGRWTFHHLVRTPPSDPAGPCPAP